MRDVFRCKHYDNARKGKAVYAWDLHAGNAHVDRRGFPAMWDVFVCRAPGLMVAKYTRDAVVSTKITAVEQ